MKAAVLYQHGGPDVFRLEEVPDAVCHRKGILIRVEAISLEGGDFLDRSGNLAPLAMTPYVVGRQAAGEIVAVGAEVEDFKVGQKAVAARPNGSYAELFAAPARTAWLIPEGLDVYKAAAIPVAFGSAYDALTHFAHLQPGETVLVQAGAGGVGIAAIQIARRLGCGAILATGSSDERLERLLPLGLDHAINHRKANVVAEVMRLTNGKGVDVIIDNLGGAALQGSIKAAAEFGRVIMLGQASREPALVDIANLIPTSAAICGFKLDVAGTRVHAAIKGLLEDCRNGTYSVLIDRVFPLSEIISAHRYVETRAAFGRVMVTI